MQAQAGAQERRNTSDDRSPVSTRIVTKVAAAKGVDQAELTPLYDRVESDALDSVIESMDDSGTVAFEYEGYEVSLRGDGRVELD